MNTRGELFAGIGGFSAGGTKTLWHVEIDKNCQSVLRRHFPNTDIFDDVCEVGIHNLKPVDIITFGSPCQDLSTAGKRKGLDGKRSGLFFEAVRIIRELNPKYAIWENVPGALSSNKGADFKSVLEALLCSSVPMPRSGRWATAGMVRSGKTEIAWRILDAQYFGLAQRRKRVFLVVGFGGRSATKVLFESDGVCGNTPPCRETREGTSENIESDAGINRTGSSQVRDYKGVGNQYNKPVTQTVPTMIGNGDAHSGFRNEYGLVLGFDLAQITSKLNYSNPKFAQPPLNSFAQNMVAFARQRTDEYKESDFVSTISQRDYKSATDLVVFQQNKREEVRDLDNLAGALSAEPRTNEQNYIWEMSHASEGVRNCGDVCPTLQQRMGTGGNQVPLIGVRRLTPTECCRLQGFQDDWNVSGIAENGKRVEMSDSTRYKQLGNAVAVPVASWIMNRIELEND
jgi:DNA (cytosine-5)-methyltransferase 1